MKILYLAQNRGNALLRSKAMERIGHTVEAIDPEVYLPKNRIARKLAYGSGGLLVANSIRKQILGAVKNLDFDVVWIDGGRYIGPALIRDLHKRAPVGMYNTDDPFGDREGASWRLFRKAVSEYRLVTINRRENISEAKALGAKNIWCTFRTADEIAHRPRPLTDDEKARFTTDVVFVGTALEQGRGAFLATLVERGIPLSIFGNKWESAKEWPVLKPHLRGAGLSKPEDYAASIIGSRVALGLLSKENRDLHTRRSIEIPALGGVFCAERTTEHLELYREDEEAVFWSTAEECAEQCNRLLKDDVFRNRIAQQGHERCLRNGHYNEPFARGFLERLTGSAHA